VLVGGGAIREPAPAKFLGEDASAGSTAVVEWNVSDPAENAIRQVSDIEATRRRSLDAILGDRILV
jgi:hypothetical protein